MFRCCRKCYLKVFRLSMNQANVGCVIDVCLFHNELAVISDNWLHIQSEDNLAKSQNNKIVLKCLSIAADPMCPAGNWSVSFQKMVQSLCWIIIKWLNAVKVKNTKLYINAKRTCFKVHFKFFYTGCLWLEYIFTNWLKFFSFWSWSLQNFVPQECGAQRSFKQWNLKNAKKPVVPLESGKCGQMRHVDCQCVMLKWAIKALKLSCAAWSLLARLLSQVTEWWWHSRNW